MGKLHVNIIVLLLVIVIGNSRAYAQANKIPWSNSIKLLWDDFQGPPDAKTDAYAYTEYWLDYTYNWDGKGKLTMKVNCSFLKNKSWRKTDKKLTEDLLEHEQRHFDIGEICARKMRQAFSNYAFAHTNSANTKPDLEHIFNQAINEAHAMDSQYDTETNHSKIKDKQQEWSGRIKSMLSGALCVCSANVATLLTTKE